MQTGLILVNTGDGKGKSTAAFGLATRALGQNLRVCIIQFVKGKWPTGEQQFFAPFAPQLEFHVCGQGFLWDAKKWPENQQLARQGWDLACVKLADPAYDLVVLDELTYLFKYEILEVTALLTMLQQRPAGMHVVVTGREAPPALLAAADLVTQMQAIKHPFNSGGKAVRGIEF